MKKDNIFEDEKRRECLISAMIERGNIGERERNDPVREEKRRKQNKMKPCLF